MKAAYYDSKGPAREVLQLGEVSIPEPRPGDVLVKIVVSAINPMIG
jgi:NADPH2:quinone reductase